MKAWLIEFIQENGKRLFYMFCALMLAFIMYYYLDGMTAEAKTIIVGVAMLCFNKSRGDDKK